MRTKLEAVLKVRYPALVTGQYTTTYHALNSLEYVNVHVTG
jgi:hypothetical protein